MVSITILSLCVRLTLKQLTQQAPEDSLVADHKHVLLAFQLHDYRLQPCYQILIRLQNDQIWNSVNVNIRRSSSSAFLSYQSTYFTFRISIVKFILVTGCELVRIFVLDLLISHLLADACIYFVQGLPLL